MARGLVRRQKRIGRPTETLDVHVSNPLRFWSPSLDCGFEATDRYVVRAKGCAKSDDLVKIGTEPVRRE